MAITDDRNDGVSVLICTYNGEKKIPETLRHLARQKTNNLQWEIIVIDNASSDATKTVVTQEWKKYNSSTSLNLFEVFERGKDRAMDIGLSKVRYSYVIICDDDNWLSADYLETAFNIMKANPQIGLLGGRGIAVFEHSVPEWFHAHEGYFAVGQQNSKNGEIKPHPNRLRFIWGAGAVINMKAYGLLLKCGYKRTITYKRYPSIARSEDVEMSAALLLTGYSLWYDDRLTYEHFITADRLSWNSFLELTKPAAMIQPYLNIYRILIAMGNAAAPDKSIGKPKLLDLIRNFVEKVNSKEDYKNILLIICQRHKQNDFKYQRHLFLCYKFISTIKCHSQYDDIYQHLSSVKNQILEYRKKNNCNIWYDTSFLPGDEACNLSDQSQLR